jgi:hypothetical protein
VLRALFIATVLVAVTVLGHGVGFGLVLRALMKSHAVPPTGAWPMTWLLIRV